MGSGSGPGRFGATLGTGELHAVPIEDILRIRTLGRRAAGATCLNAE